MAKNKCFRQKMGISGSFLANYKKSADKTTGSLSRLTGVDFVPATLTN